MDIAPERKGHRLNERGELLYAQYRHYRSLSGCSCHINPPCGVCTHDGHPIALENNDEVWEKIEPIDYMAITREFFT